MYIDAPFQQLIIRDHKGLYKSALSGNLRNVAGVDLEFIPPKNPNLIIRNSGTLNDLLAFAPSIVSELVGRK